MEGPTVPALMPLALNGVVKQENGRSSTEPSPALPAARPLPPRLSEPAVPTYMGAVAAAKAETGVSTDVPGGHAVSAPPVVAAVPAPSAAPAAPAAPEGTAPSGAAPASAAMTPPVTLPTPALENSPSSPSKDSDGADKDELRRDILRPTQTVCLNCMTTNTPLWRRDENGQILCNACGLFLKLHGRRRPISLKTDVIKSRNRSRNVGPPRRFNRKAARQGEQPARQFVAAQIPAQLAPASTPPAPPAAAAPVPAPAQPAAPPPSVSAPPAPPNALPQPAHPQTTLPSMQTAPPPQLRQVRALHMGPPAPAGMSPALTAYNFYPTGTPILGPQPGLPQLSAMPQPMSPHFRPLAGGPAARPSSPPDFRLVRGHMSEQLLPRSPPERVAPLGHVSAAEIAPATHPAPQLPELQTKVSELEVINDLLRRRITDLEFSEARARKEAAEAKARLDELQSALRQAATPAEPPVLTPDVAHPAPDPAPKEVKRIRVSELV